MTQKPLPSRKSVTKHTAPPKKHFRLASSHKRGHSLVALVAAAFAGSTITAILLSAGFARSGIVADTFEQLDLFGEVFEQVHENYVTIPDNKEMMEGAIDGMLTRLDPHSGYLSAEEYNAMQEQIRGSFAGLGIQVTLETQGRGKGLVKVISPIDDTPAHRAGLTTGDLIYEIDSKAVFGMTLTDAITLLKGARGTSVQLKLLRDGVDDPIDVEIVRDIITVNPVLSRVERDMLGYIRLASFTEQTESKMLEALKSLETDIPGGMVGLVLDLRNNPGGSLDQAVAVSSAFLNGGEIVSTRGRNPKDTMRQIGKAGDVLHGRPVIILINGGSASASEIVAGALQDRNRGLVMGTKSFGKGSVQTLIPLQDGARGGLRLTTARYYTPAGRAIQQLGIVPDIVLPVTLEGEEEAIQARRSESDLEHSLAAEGGLMQDDGVVEAIDTSLLVEPIICAADVDCQLNKALDLLESKADYTKLLADARRIDR